MKGLFLKVTGKLIIPAVMFCLCVNQAAFAEDSDSDIQLGTVVVTDTGKKAKVLNTNASMVVFSPKEISKKADTVPL